MIDNVLVQKRFVPPTSRNEFAQKFDFSEEDWPKIYSLAGKCSIDSKPRIFQYKILNNALYLNKRLFRSKLTESPLCSMCGVEDGNCNTFICRMQFFYKTLGGITECSGFNVELIKCKPCRMSF